MAYYTDDPVADAERYSADQDRQLARLPECDNCGYPIQDEHYYDVNGTILCRSCLENDFKKHTEDYI